MTGHVRALMVKLSTAVPPDKRLSSDARASLLIHGMFQFGASMSGVFLALYLWRLTHSLYVNGMYNIVLFMLTPVAFAAAGWVAKRRDRLAAYRLGILFFGLFYLCVVLAGSFVAEWYVAFAVMNAFASGFYWTSYLTLMYEVSTEQNRIRYLALNMISFTLAGLAGPALAGFLISRYEGLHGYMIVYTIAFVMFALTSLVSLRIKAIPTHHRAYYLRMMGLLLRKNRAWRRSLVGYLMIGMLQGLMLFLPNLLLFEVVPREDMVGYLGILFSGMAIATGYGMGKWAKARYNGLYLLIAAAGFTAGAIILLLQVSLVTVIAFIVMYNVFNVIQNNSMTNYYYGLIGKLPLKGALRIESVVVRELFVNTGRVIAIGVLLTMADNLQGGMLPVVILAASVIQFVLILLTKRSTDRPL